jgi:hypothetical protein
MTVMVNRLVLTAFGIRGVDAGGIRGAEAGEMQVFLA